LGVAGSLRFALSATTSRFSSAAFSLSSSQGVGENQTLIARSLSPCNKEHFFIGRSNPTPTAHDRSVLPIKSESFSKALRGAVFNKQSQPAFLDRSQGIALSCLPIGELPQLLLKTAFCVS
jgi:hypothetical protein